MAFKYLNPGYVPISYGFSNNQSIRTIRSNTYNPRCGVALIGGGIGTNCIIENAITNDANSLHIKFDIFLPAETVTTSTTSINFPAKGTIFKIVQQGSNLTVTPFDNDNYSLNVDSTNLKLGAVNTVLLQLNAGSSSWSLTAFINDSYYPAIDDLTDSYFSGIVPAQSYVAFQISNLQPISNIIISDSDIDFKEVIVEVDSSAVETTMTARNDGTYSTAQIGDYVLKTLDTTGLYSNFGSDSSVLGMALFAAPAFTTGSDVMLLKGRTVNGATTTDYPPPAVVYGGEIDDYYYLQEMTEEEFAEINSSYTLALPCYYIQLPVSSGTTLAALNGLKVGWVSSD